MATRIQIRRDTATKWAANNPVLALGEPGLETDTFIIKYGDGSSAWNDLPYANVDSLSDFTTTDLVEGNNLYFSNARVYANVIGFGFVSNTYLNYLSFSTNAQLTNYLTNTQLVGYATNTQLVGYATNADLNANYLTTEYVDVRLQSYAKNSSLTTANVSELNNLYFTNARVYANVVLSNFATNAQINSLTTTNILESGNLYFTNSRAIGALTAGSGISLAANGLLVSTVTGNVTSNVISVAGASGDVSNVQLAAGITSSGILTTANVAEVNNLYYSNSLVSANVATLGYASNTYVISQLSQIFWPAVTRLSVTNSGASAYNFSSHYSTNNPNVYAISGTTISFSLNVAGHPFLLQEDSGSGYTNINSLQLFHYTTAGVLTTGSSAQGQVTGTLYWNVPFGTSNTYRYICGIHSNMVGNVIVKDISVI